MEHTDETTPSALCALRTALDVIHRTRLLS